MGTLHVKVIKVFLHDLYEIFHNEIYAILIDANCFMQNFYNKFDRHRIILTRKITIFRKEVIFSILHNILQIRIAIEFEGICKKIF